MSFYSRKIPIYKSFRVIDSDGDGKADSMVYAPLNDFYYLQIGIEQTTKDIGYYKTGLDLEEEAPFEVICSSNLWDLTNNGSNDNDTSNLGGISLSPLTADTIGTNLQQSANEYCADPTATNYNASLSGNTAFTPCPNNSCCTYLSSENYSSGSPANPGSSSEPLECLTVYTDWGPWNDNLLLDDYENEYNTGGGTNASCVITLRFINLSANSVGTTPGFGPSTPIQGGWYGSEIKIEIDSGNGFEVINQGNSLISGVEESIEFNSSNSRWTLGEKVRLFRASHDQGYAIGKDWYSTKPYRDLTLSPPSGSQIKITYYNPQVAPPQLGPLELLLYDLRLQIIQGPISNPIPLSPTTTTPEDDWEWEIGQNTLSPSFMPVTPKLRYDEGGESFYFIDSTASNNDVSNSLMVNYWDDYLSNDSSANVPWGPQNSQTTIGVFYNIPNLSVLYDFGDSSVIPPSTVVDYFSNPSEELTVFPLTCSQGSGSSNFVSYFDKDGDGYIEWDTDYPNIDANNPGSVDDGLFSKTRYDSPYIYLKPGTKDGSELFGGNALTQNTGTNPEVVGPSSSGGWKMYAYKDSLAASTYLYTNVSPTCQLSGVDNDFTSDPNLVDQSNSNIFLPQTDVGTGVNMENAANIKYFKNTGFTEVKINHLWNRGSTDAEGGCCAKQYGTQFNLSTEGPYMKKECSQCHGQLTTRSAQPVFDPQTIIDMQTTDSNVFYGPFFDSTNPTYNGYGLAFSKANNYCRNIRNKNGVDQYNSSQGTKEKETFIGGILHGGAKQYSYGSTLYNMYTDTLGTRKNNTKWESVFPPCDGQFYLPLKCIPVLGGIGNDENCLSAKCMKCSYCFKCSPFPVQPGVFVGNTSTAPSGTGGSTSGANSGANNGVNQLPSVNQISGNNLPPSPNPITFDVSNSPNDLPGSTPGNYNGTIEIAVNNPNNPNNLQILTDTSVIPGTSGPVDIVFEITDTSTQTVHTNITYTVTTPNTNTESINLPQGAYTYTLQSNRTLASYGVTQISFI